MSKQLYDLSQITNPRDKRLAKEHISLEELCSKSDKISYEITRRSGAYPEAYRITFKLKSIVGIDTQQNPIYGYQHTAEVSFPLKYPIEPPKLSMLTEVWHPNIKSDGPYKGRICGNTKDFGKLYDMFLLVQRIGEILQYKNYHAENTYPYPEDEKVARWVREFAEPHGIVDNRINLVVDNSNLMNLADNNNMDSVYKTSVEVKHTPPPVPILNEEKIEEEPKAEEPKNEETVNPIRKTIVIGDVRKKEHPTERPKITINPKKS